LKKSKKDNATLFIDASQLSVRVGNKNKLTDDYRKQILSAYIERKDELHFAKLVLNSDIAENDYNIAVSSYVEQENTSEEVDIEKLNAHIAEIVIKQNKLRLAIDEIIADLEGGNI
jgi:type I restriction enzyme M protein